MISNENNLLSIKSYPILLITRFLFIFAVQMQFTLISWEIYNTTKDVLYIGYTSLAELIPAFILAFYGGYIVDKYNRKRILLGGIICSSVSSCFLLLILTFHPHDMVLVSSMLLVVFCSGIYRVFVGPAQTALLGEIVPKYLYARATTWYSATWQIAIVSGPSTIGFVYAFYGIVVAQVVIVCCILGAAITCCFIRNKATNINKSIHNTFIESIKIGWKFVWNTKEILASFTLDMFGVLFGGATAMLPVFIKEVYHIQTQYLGILRSSISIGTIGTLLFLSFMPIKKKQGLILLISVFLFGLSMVGFGLTTQYWIAFFILILSGVFDGISVNIRSTILQLKTPDEIKGKVAAIGTLFVMSSNEIGSLESSIAAKFLGLQNSVIFGGIATMLIVIFVFAYFPKLKKMNY